MRRLLRIALIGLFCFAVSRAAAATVSAHVTYVAANAVYLDAGSVQGVSVGDVGVILQAEVVTALVEVLFVADNSSSCRVIEAKTSIQAGDEVTLSTRAQPAVLTQETQPRTEPAVPELPTRGSARRHANRLAGRLALQVFSLDDQTDGNRSYVQPAMTANLQWENIGGGFHTFSMFGRSRWKSENVRFQGVEKSVWDSRVYEAALTYENPESPWGYRIGRVRSRDIAGIGEVDGLLVRHRSTRRVAIGAYGGTMPDLVSSRIDSRTTKGGLFASYESPATAALSVRTGLALNGEYRSGQVSRESLHEQFGIRANRKVMVYQSTEVSINRAWRQTVTGKSLEAASTLLQVRYVPWEVLMTTLSFDNRTNVRTYETRDTPDSLFDNRYQQGLRAGIEWRPVRSVVADATAGTRRKQLESESTKSGSFGVSVTDFARTGVHAVARLSVFSNPISEGWQPRIGFSYSFLDRLYLTLEAGRDHYDMRRDAVQINANWQRLSAEFSMQRRWYGSATLESQRGSGVAQNRIFLETGYRW